MLLYLGQMRFVVDYFFSQSWSPRICPGVYLSRGDCPQGISYIHSNTEAYRSFYHFEIYSVFPLTFLCVK